MVSPITYFLVSLHGAGPLRAPAAGNEDAPDAGNDADEPEVRETLADEKTAGPASSLTAPDFKWQFLLLVL
jgi:hypothetical protein